MYGVRPEEPGGHIPRLIKRAEAIHERHAGVLRRLLGTNVERPYLFGARRKGCTDSNFDSSAPSSVEHGGIVVDKFSTLDNGSERKTERFSSILFYRRYVIALTCLGIELNYRWFHRFDVDGNRIAMDLDR